ncbi:hypothetical protein [Streptomyces alkaliterrae]|uniref:hypothetical protein n=1 Tax=Streptomyces alkaliterrae TaxID=2213162 RepID=UPI00129723E1|nr:hypothetical protein [Streptomyces alkaliterrae]
MSVLPIYRLVNDRLGVVRTLTEVSVGGVTPQFPPVQLHLPPNFWRFVNPAGQRGD